MEKFKFNGFFAEVSPEGKITQLTPMTDKETNESIEEIKEGFINQFNEQRTAKNLQLIINAGIEPKELINNEWKLLNSWQDGFNEFNEVIPLYEKINGNFTVTGVGFFKKIDR